MNEKEYSEFLKQLKKNYKFVFFDEINFNEENQIILRHDIDFDVQLAKEIALIENSLKIKSTFFFLITSESYNIMNKDNFKDIVEIKKMGHQISLHFDPINYDDYEKGLLDEINYFENHFNTKVKIISLHRPNEFFLTQNKSIKNIEHTYLSKYFNDIKYFADSRGIWRYGNPIESEEFKNNKNLQILVHPIWWVVEGENWNETLKNYFKIKKEKLKNHYSKNCIPFMEIRNEIE